MHAWIETEIAKWQIQKKQKSIYDSPNYKYEQLKSLNVNLIYDTCVLIENVYFDDATTLPTPQKVLYNLDLFVFLINETSNASLHCSTEKFHVK